MRLKVFWLYAFVSIICAIPFLNALQWEGNASMSRYGEFPDTGRYAASNSFSRNTLVTVENLENGRTVKVIIVKRLNDSGLFILLSREAAAQLGIEQEEIVRVRVTLAREESPMVTLKPEDMPFNPDPDINPSAGVEVPANERYPEETEERATEKTLIKETATEEKEPEEEVEITDSETPPPKPVKAITALPAQISGEQIFKPDSIDLPEEPELAEPETGETLEIPLLEEVPLAEKAEEKINISAPDIPEIKMEEGEKPVEEVTPSEATARLVSKDTMPVIIAEDAEIILEPAKPKPPEESVPRVEEISISKRGEDKTAEEEKTLSEEVYLPEIEITPPEEKAPAIKEELVTRLEVAPSLEEKEEKPVTPGKLSPFPEIAVDKPEPSPIPEELLLRKLEKNMYYLQLGAYSEPNSARGLADRLIPSFPVAVYSTVERDKTVYKVLVGPVNEDETGALIYNLKARGYKDVFLRRGN